MKKLIKNIVFILILFVSLITSFNIGKKNIVFNELNSQQDNVGDLINFDYTMNKNLLKKINPTYPSFNVSSKDSSLHRIYIDTSGDSSLPNKNSNDKTLNPGNDTWYSQTWTTVELNINNYAQSKEQFIKFYPKFDIKFQWGANGWDSHTGWWNGKWGNGKNLVYFNRTITIDTKQNNSVKLVGNNDESSSGQRKAAGETYISTSWIGDKFQISIINYAKVWWQGGSRVKHAMLMAFKGDSYTFKSVFDFNDNFKKTNKQLGKGKIDGNLQDSSELGKTIKYESKTSPDIKEAKNWSDVTGEIKKRIKTAFNNDSDTLIDFLNVTYASILENNKYYIDTQFSFYNWSTGRNTKWSFRTYVEFTLGEEYWNKNIESRLEIIPGNVIDKDGIKIKQDIEEVINEGDGKDSKYNKGVIKFHTTTRFIFLEKKNNANDPDYDSVKVNGVNLNAVNGTYLFTMEDLYKFGDDNSERQNKYEIVVNHKINPIIPGDKGGSYSITITIESILDTLDLNLMNWGNKNPDYDKLTEPFLKDPVTGKDVTNPDYDPEISKASGTKKQIIWVKHKSHTPFPLDPVDKNNMLIKSEEEKDYELGYIAEASSVGNVGFQNTWNSQNIEKIERFSSDINLNTDFSKKGYLVPKGEIDINTSKGMYHFQIENKKFPSLNGEDRIPLYLQKFMYIGNENYGRFLDNVSVTNAENFWSTSHGRHLKNFMILYKGWDKAESEDFFNLSYEALMAYWRDYVSSIRNNWSSPDDKPANFIDLNEVDVADIKMNRKTSAEIWSKVAEKINGYVAKESKKAKYAIDYYIQYKVGEAWKDILSGKELETIDKLDIFPSGEPGSPTRTKKISLRIKANDSSMIFEGISHEFKIINSLEIDEDNLVDLSKVIFKDQEYNFENRSAADLYEKYIDYYISETFKNYKINAILDSDYKISSKGFNGEKLTVDDEVLNNFVNSIKENSINNTKFKVSVYAMEDSFIFEGITSYKLIHDKEKEIAPDKPNPENPGDKDPNKNKKENKLKKQLWWIISIVVFTILSIGVGTWIVMVRKRSSIDKDRPYHWKNRKKQLKRKKKLEKQLKRKKKLAKNNKVKTEE